MRVFRRNVALLCLASGVLACVSPAQADVVLGQHDWDTGGEGWESLYGWTSLVDPQSPGGNPGGYLEVNFGATAAPEILQDEWYDIVKVDAGALFAGDWDNHRWIQFDFWAENVAAGALQVQWQSETNSAIWAYSLTPSVAGAWTTYRAPLDDWSDWLYPGASEEQFLSDLASIDWVGLYIYRNTGADQNYGLDNFSLMVPEPGEIVMLAIALMTSAWSVRKKHAGKCVA